MNKKPLNISEDKLRTIIREEVTDILKKEFMKFRMSLIPEISSEEQKEIEKSYKKPEYDPVETIDLENV